MTYFLNTFYTKRGCSKVHSLIWNFSKKCFLRYYIWKMLAKSQKNFKNSMQVKMIHFNIPIVINPSRNNNKQRKLTVVCVKCKKYSKGRPLYCQKLPPGKILLNLRTLLELWNSVIKRCFFIRLFAKFILKLEKSDFSKQHFQRHVCCKDVVLSIC